MSVHPPTGEGCRYCRNPRGSSNSVSVFAACHADDLRSPTVLRRCVIYVAAVAVATVVAFAAVVVAIALVAVAAA
eukprot:921284-Alexandrium_andersonii.AAC.1